MTAAHTQLCAELYPPTASPVRPQLRDDPRARAIRIAMRKLRARRRRAGLNNRGQPMKQYNRQFVNKKYRRRYA